MNKRDVLEVAIKIMGLYSLLSFIGNLMFLGTVLLSVTRMKTDYQAMNVLFTCLSPLLYLVFAMVFLWRGRRLAEMLTRDSEFDRAGEKSALPPYAQLYFWIKILGLYFFVSAISQLGTIIAQSGITMPGSFRWNRLIDEAIKLGLSIVFIFGSERVAKIVERTPDNL